MQTAQTIKDSQDHTAAFFYTFFTKLSFKNIFVIFI